MYLLLKTVIFQCHVRFFATQIGPREVFMSIGPLADDNIYPRTQAESFLHQKLNGTLPTDPLVDTQVFPGPFSGSCWRFLGYSRYVPNLWTIVASYVTNSWIILLMAEILHQLIGMFIPLCTGLYTSQVVQDFFHQEYVANSWIIVASYFLTNQT